MRRTIPMLMLAALAIAPSGCAALAKKPDTPAAKITIEELEREPAPPCERYYILVFGSQSDPRQAKYTHSWSTVVRVVDRGQGQSPCIEASTISWMPATLDIHPMNFRVEPGVNLDLCTTIREMLSHDERISMWGPYEIRRGLYLKSRMQRDFLESGAIGYQCIDVFGEAPLRGNGCNCIHGMTDMDAKLDRNAYPVRKYGEKASEHIVKQIIDRKAVIDPCTTHDWLIGALGIADCPIVRQQDDGHRTRQQIKSAERANRDSQDQ